MRSIALIQPTYFNLHSLCDLRAAHRRERTGHDAVEGRIRDQTGLALWENGDREASIRVFRGRPAFPEEVTDNPTLRALEGLLLRPGRRVDFSSVKIPGASCDEIIMAKEHRKSLLSLV